MLHEKLEAASRRAFRRRLILIVSVAGGVILLAIVLFSFQMDRFRPVAEEATVVLVPEPVPAGPSEEPEGSRMTDNSPSVSEAPSPKANDSTSTADEALPPRVNEAREQFKGALRDFEETIAPALNNHGFSAWESGSKALIQSKKNLAIDAFAQGAFGKALSLLGEARDRATRELSRHMEETATAVQAAEDAYEHDNHERAQENIEKAIRWKPGDDDVSALRDKISKMPALLAHLKAAEGKRHENDLDGELKELQAALNLDPDRKEAKTRERALSKRVLERRFSRAIQSGLDAVGRRDLPVATKELGAAKSLAPLREEVSFLEQKVQILDRDLQIETLLEKAALHAERDEWEGARQQYEAARSIEPENFLVDRGYRRAAEIVALQEELSNFADAHQRLASPNVAKLAQAAISRAGPLSVFSAELGKASEHLVKLISQYDRTVDVLVISDGHTSVSVRSVGRVGVTEGRSIQLKPGPYTFEGHRQGYKSKLVQVAIPPGVSSFEVKVICDERI